nr:hypothetical protein SYMBAF_30158 [Serratia symbiotica]
MGGNMIEFILGTFILGSLAVIVILLSYRLGWESAHLEVARECERLGKFYVGNKTFQCILIRGNDNGAQAR